MVYNEIKNKEMLAYNKEAINPKIENQNYLFIVVGFIKKRE
jgi:hypothetical protein